MSTTDDDQQAGSFHFLTLPTPEVANTTTQKPRDSWWRRRRNLVFISSILLVVLLAGFLTWFFTRPSSLTYQDQDLTAGDLSLSANATGPVQSALYNVNFSGTGGKIVELNTKVGAQVKEGDILGKLDSTALNDAYQQQLAAYNAAQANYQQALNQADANNNQASTNANNAQTNLTGVQAQAQAQVNAAQTNLDNAKNSLKTAQDNVNTQTQQAELKRQQDLLQCQSTPTIPVSTVQPVSTNNVSCEQIAQQTYDQTIAAANNAVSQAQAQVNTSEKALESAQVNANASVNSAQGQVNTGQAQINTTDTTGETSITTIEGQLNIQKKQLEIAQHNLDNATIRAPHAGTVAQVNGIVGGTPGLTNSAATPGDLTPSASGAIFIQIVDLSVLQIQAHINESDTANLEIGQIATFTINAYGERLFQGKVSTISPIGLTTSNVVTYPVTIDVDQSSLHSARLFPGMTANVTITTIQRQNVLLLPVNAINFARLASSGNNANNSTPQLLTKQEANNLLVKARLMLQDLQHDHDMDKMNPIPAFVIQQVGTQFVGKPVVLGLTDGTNYEILAGLSLHDHFLIGSH